MILLLLLELSCFIQSTNDRIILFSITLSFMASEKLNEIKQIKVRKLENVGNPRTYSLFYVFNENWREEKFERTSESTCLVKPVPRWWSFTVIYNKRRFKIADTKTKVVARWKILYISWSAASTRGGSGSGTWTCWAGGAPRHGRDKIICTVNITNCRELNSNGVARSGEHC